MRLQLTNLIVFLQKNSVEYYFNKNYESEQGRRETFLFNLTYDNNFFKNHFKKKDSNNLLLKTMFFKN